MESNGSELRLDVERIWLFLCHSSCNSFLRNFANIRGHSSYHLFKGNDAVLVPRQCENAELFDSDTEVA